MEVPSHEQEADSASVLVFQLIGEPAIAINGVPDVNQAPGSSTQLEMLNNPDLNDEICFGEWMEGRKVSKMFGDMYYYGKVVTFDREMKWYRVVYEDGDFEDLDWHELEEVLLPLDISIPLRKLALRTLKHANSVKESGKRFGESRKRRPTNVRNADWSTKNSKRRRLTNNGNVDRSSTSDTRRKHPRKAGSADQTSKLLQSPQGAKSRRKTSADLRRRRSTGKSLEVDPDKVSGSHMINVEIKDVDLQRSLESELKENLMEPHKMLLDKKTAADKSMMFEAEIATASEKFGKSMKVDPDKVSGSRMINVEIKEVDLQGSIETELKEGLMKPHNAAK